MNSMQQSMYRAGNTPQNVQVCSPMIMPQYTSSSFGYQQNTYPFSQQDGQMSPSVNMNMNLGMIFSPTQNSMVPPVFIDNQGKITMMPGDPSYGSMSQVPTLPILTLTTTPSATSIDASSTTVCTDEQSTMVSPVQAGLATPMTPSDFSEQNPIAHPMMCTALPVQQMIAQTSSPSTTNATTCSSNSNPEDSFNAPTMSPGVMQQNMYQMSNSVVSPPGGFVSLDNMQTAWMTAGNLGYPQIYSPQSNFVSPYPPVSNGFMQAMPMTPPFSPGAFAPQPHYSAQDFDSTRGRSNSNSHHRGPQHVRTNNHHRNNHQNNHKNKYNNHTKVNQHHNHHRQNQRYNNYKKSAEYPSAASSSGTDKNSDDGYCTERRNSSSSSTCTRTSNKSRKGFRNRCKACSSPASRGFTKELSNADLEKAFGDINHILDSLPEFFGEPQLNFPEIVSYIQMFRPEGTADELQYFKVPRPTKERELQVDVRLAELFVRNFGFDHACEASDFERISVHDSSICQARMVYRQVIVQSLLPQFHQLCDVPEAQDIFNLIFRFTGCCTPKDICETFPQVWSSTVPVNSSTAIEITGVVSNFNYHLFRRYIVKKNAEENQV